MADQTTNYDLVKPDVEELINVEIINANYDIIDTELKAVSDVANAGGSGVNEYHRYMTSALTHDDVGNTEVNMPKLAIENIPITNAQLHKIDGSILIVPSAAGIQITIRLRRDTALSGAQLQSWVVYSESAGLDQTIAFNGFFNGWANDADGDLYFSVQRTGGTAGTFDVYGNFHTHVFMRKIDTARVNSVGS